jgi:hypothetical protein
MTDRDRYTIGYRELRALVEDQRQPPPSAEPAALYAAIDEHLRMHCRNCGELLDRRLREESQQFCYACVDELPSRTGSPA